MNQRPRPSRPGHAATTNRRIPFGGIVLTLVACLVTSVAAQKPTPSRSTKFQPSPLKQRSVKPCFSADGRFVVFQSLRSDLVANDTNNVEDVFVFTRGTGKIRRVSVDSIGRQGDAASYAANVSADGRFVAFASDATNLIPNDTNGTEDIFVHDLMTGNTRRISVSTTGEQGNNSSRDPAISGDGRYVVFTSTATDLVPGDTNRAADVFLHDRQTGRTSRISVGSSTKRGSTGTSGDSLPIRPAITPSDKPPVAPALDQADAGSGEPAISQDGRYVAFFSHAKNLVADDQNGRSDIFLRDLRTATTTCVSVNSEGAAGDNHSRIPAISADGRYVAFESFASNLVPGDTNSRVDVFLHDRTTRATTRVSVSSEEKQVDGDSHNPAVSADGRLVVFSSFASNLVRLDTNNRYDVFVRDRKTGRTSMISVSSAGGLGKHDSDQPSLSGDGRYVAFSSKASNLIPGDKNSSVDVFIRDRKSSKTVGASVLVKIPDPTPKGEP